jgi:hypothetical protein
MVSNVGPGLVQINLESFSQVPDRGRASPQYRIP